MDSDTYLGSPASKVARHDTNYKLCVICQTNTNEKLVETPRAHKTIFDNIVDRAAFGEGRYIDILKRIDDGVSINLFVSRSPTWHRTCYQNAANVSYRETARKDYDRNVSDRLSHKECSPSVSNASIFTRSHSEPYDRTVCFFCDGRGSIRNPLNKSATPNAGRNLREAIEKGSDEKLKVRLNTAINTNDAVAIDIVYHKRCWTLRVSNVIRNTTHMSEEINNDAISKLAADIEFVNVLEGELRNGHVFNMGCLQEVYINIRSANKVIKPDCSRKDLKHVIETRIPDVEFHKSKHVNRPDRVSIKETRDGAIQMAVDNETDMDSKMKLYYDAAAEIRKAISKSEKWEFNGSFTDTNENHLPMDLYTFYRWVIQGPTPTVVEGAKQMVVNKHAMSLTQTTMSMHMTDRQARNTCSQTVRYRNEMPQELAVGLAIRQAYRSKKLINLLHGFGLSVDYTRLLRLETQIANSVIEQMFLNDGMYTPPNLVNGRYIFFAADNVDFAEDTPDGKRTLHATAMSIYQRHHPDDMTDNMQLVGRSADRSIKNMPDTITQLLECNTPKNIKPQSPVYPSYSVAAKSLSDTCLPDYAWLVGRTLARFKTGNTDSDNIHHETDDNDVSVASPSAETISIGHNDNESPMESIVKVHIPTWAAFRSITSAKLPLTIVTTPPLIAAPAHEWPTLLTVLKQAQGINTHVVGPNRMTVITLDMGLYVPAKQMQMSRDDMDHLLLRPGELHIVMAQLRTIGQYIENSGIDFCWTEAGLYGPATVTQILEGKHVKRGIDAHMVTLQALFMLYGEFFFASHGNMHDQLVMKGDVLNNVSATCDQEKITAANDEMLDVMVSQHFIEEMSKFDAEHASDPLFKVMQQYMQMVLEMIAFIGAVRTGDWELHIATVTKFVKYFFAHDKLNYARMMPLYLADMDAIKDANPDIYAEFMQGNWVVNKNQQVPFCAIGADHALEQINRSMKVAGGLVGITLNPSARTRFFLIAPELARLAKEAQQLAGLSAHTTLTHHDLSEAVQTRQERNVQQLVQTLRRFRNPFTEDSEDLCNIVTGAVLPDNVKDDLCNRNEIGQCMFDDFVSQRVKTGEVNLWAPMKKRKLHTWKNTGAKVTVKSGQKLVEVQDDRSLFARMLVVSKSRSDINLKDAIGEHEFSVIPRALFAADGSMLHCSVKSNLMKILEDIPSNLQPGSDNDDVVHETQATEVKVALVDAMAEVQSLHKAEWIKTCSDLGNHFTTTVFSKYSTQKYDEIHLIFDRYDVPQSLKTSVRERRQGGKPPVAYHITDTTNIAHIPLKLLLSHVSTKMELSAFLAEKALRHCAKNEIKLVVAWSDKCESTHLDTNHLASDQEEADTKLLLHAHDAATRGATRIDIHSPDTDVIVLALRRYPELCRDTSFVTGVGNKRRTIPLRPICEALGSNMVAALPGFHSLTGADITGSFAGKGKLTCWKVFHSSSEDIISAFSNLGKTIKPTEDTMDALEHFVCQLYIPQTQVTDVKDLRWWLFKKKQAQSESLPPTKDALRYAILRAHYQAMIWNNDQMTHANIPSPLEYGWHMVDGRLEVVTTTRPPAPESVINLIKCGCGSTNCATRQCKCRNASLNCTDLCRCSEDECQNKEVDTLNEDADSDNDIE